jgi:hypothetical protein
MTAAALLVLVTVAAVSLWALRARPGRLAVEDFARIWASSAWGKQLLVDFYGLEVILALWMIGHATAHDSLGTAVACIALMPIFGAMAAAGYWLLAVGS